SVPRLPAGWAQRPPLSHSSVVQVSPSSVHSVPGASLFARHVPVPLQLSGSVQSVSAPLPHGVLAGSLLDRQTLLPLQVSGLSQSVSVGSPHDVPLGSNPSDGQTPAEHVSWTSHSPVSGRHSVPSGSGPLQFPVSY